MENINKILFLWLNAAAHPPQFAVDLATVIATLQIWIIPLTIALIWLRGDGVPLIPVYSTTVVAPSIHAGYSGAHRNISF